MFNPYPTHPLTHNYPGASFAHPHLQPYNNGNVNGPHLATLAGGDSFGYWAQVPADFPNPDWMSQWGLPPAIQAAVEGRGTGVYGLVPGGQGPPFNYGWPKYGPMPLKPELGGYVGKLNPYGRGHPHGFWKTLN